MASEKNLKAKQNVVKEITSKINDSASVIVFSYQGMTVADMDALRNELRKSNSEVKIYKNTLAKRAFNDANIQNDEFWEGPNAILFGSELLEPIKVISKFSKNNEHIVIRTGLADGKILTLDEIKAYAEIPSREGLLCMFASGLMQHAKEFAIGLDLYAKKLEENNN
jgi:large subunit ribosomal protein L10